MDANWLKLARMHPNIIKFIGGPRDGDLLKNELEFLPDIIDGNAIHLFGDNAYALVEVNYNNGTAMYEPVKLVHNENDESME